jgi:hypothetical protein
MNIHKLIIYIAAAFLGISVIFGAAGTGAAAAAARAENAELREYTPGELSCMSQYYYKRTSESGFYPPKVSCRDMGNGLYEIILFEEVKEADGTDHSTTYAQYSIGTDAKGTDTIFGKAIDLTLYSKVYTPEELCKLAQNHYYKANDFYPPNVSYTANKDGTYTICMFEMIEDDGGTPHSATCGWYTVNVCGVGTDDMMMQTIDLNE